MDLEDIKRGLRAEIKKRENEQYFTFQCNVRQMCKDVLAKLEEQESEIAELEEELVASKRKEKASRELADPYTLYCEASAESLRKALGEYRWLRPCDERPPEWSCVIVYFHNEEGEDQYRLAVYSKENGWEVDDEEVYKTAEIEAWHPLPMPPEDAK